MTAPFPIPDYMIRDSGSRRAVSLQRRLLLSGVHEEADVGSGHRMIDLTEGVSRVYPILVGLREVILFQG